MTTFIAIFIQLILALHPAAGARTFKTVIADGSVWVDVYERGALKMTVRLCDHNPQRPSSRLAKGNGSSAR